MYQNPVPALDDGVRVNSLRARVPRALPMPKVAFVTKGQAEAAIRMIGPRASCKGNILGKKVIGNATAKAVSRFSASSAQKSSGRGVT